MGERDDRPFIDQARHRAEFERRRREIAQHADQRKLVTRAKVRVVRDFLKVAQLGTFTVTSDEHAPMGGGEAPTPLQYFVAAVGF